MSDLGERVAVVEQRQDTLDKAQRALTADVRQLVAALASLKGAAWMVAVLWPVFIAGTMIVLRVWK